MFLNLRFRVYDSDEVVYRLINMNYVVGIRPNEEEGEGCIIVYEEGVELRVLDSYESIKESLGVK